MKYLVKNRKTGEEVLCEKVEIGGFDYYISNSKILFDEYYIYCNQISRRVRKSSNAEYPYPEYRKIIATNNKSLDLPQVVDEVEGLVDKLETPIGLDTWTYDEGFRIGYQKAKETFEYTKEDIVEFVEYINLHYRALEHTISLKGVDGTLELLNIWQEQRIKTIIVE